MIPVGESKIELAGPTDPSSAISKFIEKRGEGIHHICFEVENLGMELARLKAAGFQLIDERGRAWERMDIKLRLYIRGQRAGCSWSLARKK